MRIAAKLGHIQELLETAREELHDIRPHGDEQLRVAAQKLLDALRIIEQRCLDYYVSNE